LGIATGFAALALIQIWPTWDYVGASLRPKGVESLEFIGDGSMSWRMALTQLTPFFFNDPRDQEFYWGAKVGFHEVNAYAGWAAYLLAFIA